MPNTISDFNPASSVAATDKLLLQQGDRTTPYTYGTVGQVLNGTLTAAPRPAAEIGFLRRVFFDDFTSASTVTTTGATSGFNWYPGLDTGTLASPTNFQVLTGVTAAGISGAPYNAGNSGGGANASAAGGILQINGHSTMTYNAIFQSVPKNSTDLTQGPNAWKHCYIECYFQFNIANVGSNGWPALWTWALATTGVSNQPVEIDIMEAGFTGQAPTVPGVWSVHDPGGNTVDAAANQVSGWIGLTGANAMTNPLTTGAATGAPGTLPTGWTLTPLAGLSTSILSIGPYLDLRIFGTASASGPVALNPSGSNGWTTTVGSLWSFQWDVTVVGGSTAHINSMTLFLQDQISGSFHGSIDSTVINPTTMQKTFYTQGKTTAGSNQTSAYWAADITSGAVVDITLRFYNPVARLGVLDSNWHTYGVRWQGDGAKGSLDFYFDNSHVGGPVTVGRDGQVVDMESTAGLSITLGTGLSAPVYVDWVGVWMA